MGKTRLSVNLNKVALIRNARGADYPNLLRFAQLCEEYGAHGITVHPRPDERHVRFSDLPELKEIVTTEFNIEGYPSPRFLQAVKEVRPHQVTLVPDAPDALTSDTGWDTREQQGFLTDVIGPLKEVGIRVSIFLDPIPELVEGAHTCGADRIELYTGEYAKRMDEVEIKLELQKHIDTANRADQYGLGVNAGHDLNLNNLQTFVNQVPNVLEVSIGHALTVDSLHYGLKNAILMYLSKLQ